MKHRRRLALAVTGLALAVPAAACSAAAADAEPCAQAAPGSRVVDPPEVRSHDGRLNVALTLRSQRLADGRLRFCYLTADGRRSPTLRVRPGDDLIVQLRNGLEPAAGAARGSGAAVALDPCAPRPMTRLSTNLHFHGLTVAALCHQDEVLHTLVEPGDAPFEYRIHVAADEPPGLYWYHAHAHGLAAEQVGGGASGALVVEDAGASRPDAARGLRERVLVIRDEALRHPDAPPAQSEPTISPTRRDRDGDAGNSGTGYGKPARDLSINGVPVPYPGYETARLEMPAHARECWRVVNASSVTYLNLAYVVDGVAQELEVLAVDGVPLDWQHAGALRTRRVDHLGLPPGARMEFIVKAPAAGARAQWVTRAVDTGPDGENDPVRPLLQVVARGDASAPAPPQAAAAAPQPGQGPGAGSAARAWLGDVAPARTRRFYFWETPFDSARPNQPAEFYLTEQGHPLRVFDPAAAEPDVIVQQGEVEDWIIENRTREVHAFHIHQLHFQVREWFGVELDEQFVRDTVNVPFYDYQMSRFPRVVLRMDFRDPATTGTFVYHCHLLDHEDGGMMGTIRVEPRPAAQARQSGTGWLASLRQLGRWIGPAEGVATGAALPPATATPPAARVPALAAFCRSGALVFEVGAGRGRRGRAAGARGEPPLTPAARAQLAAYLGLGL